MCDQVEEALLNGAPLDAAAQAHVAACEACRGLLAVDQALRVPVDVPPMPAELVASVMAAVEARPVRAGWRDAVAAFVLFAGALFAASGLVAWQPSYTAMADYLSAVWSGLTFPLWDVNLPVISAPDLSTGMATATLLATLAMVAWLNARWAKTQPS